MTERRPKLSTCSIATVRGISFSFPIAEDFQISAQLLALRTFRKESSPLRSPSRSAFALWEELGTFGPWQVLVPLCSAPLGDGVRSTGSGGASAALISAPAPLSSTGAEPGSSRAPHQPPWEQNAGLCALGHPDMGEGQLPPNGCRAVSPALSAHR